MERPFSNPARRNIGLAKSKPAVKWQMYSPRGSMLAAGTYETGKNLIPFMYVEATVKQARGNLMLIAFGAYNAFGLIGPEKGGVALVDEKRHDVVGTLDVPYSPEKRLAVLNRIALEKNWGAAAQALGFGMRYMPNPGKHWHGERALDAWAKFASIRKADGDPEEAAKYLGRWQAHDLSERKARKNPGASTEKKLRMFEWGIEDAKDGIPKRKIGKKILQREYDQGYAIGKLPPGLTQRNPGGAALGGKLGMPNSGKKSGWTVHVFSIGSTFPDAYPGYKTLPAAIAAAKNKHAYGPTWVADKNGQVVWDSEKQKNPGAAYHEKEAKDSKAASSQFEPGSYQQGFFRGEASAHRHSAYESRRKGINPLLMTVTNPTTCLTPGDRKSIRMLVDKTDVRAQPSYVIDEVLRSVGKFRSEKARRQMVSYARAMFKKHQAPYVSNPGKKWASSVPYSPAEAEKQAKALRKAGIGGELEVKTVRHGGKRKVAWRVKSKNPGATKRWVVVVPYKSGSKRTVLFSAADKDAAKKLLTDMWFSGKLDSKSGEKPEAKGWKVKRVGK